MSSTLFCSAIIPTVGRDTLARAVESVLSQDLPEDDFEVIVINDSGRPLHEESWQQSTRVRVITTQRRERSVARNTGAAAARGRFLHFLDDDDWMAPGAYRHFLELSQNSSAAWLYGITQLIDRKNRPTIQLRHALPGNCFVHAMAGEWLPLQSSLIDRQTFLRLGGFNPLLSGPEDIDLQRRVLLEADTGETAHLVAYVIRGEQGSTTDYSHHSQASRLAREAVLDSTGVFQRMRSSADSPFWRGRMLRVYLTSAAWNLRRLHGFRAGSRALFSLASLAAAGSGLVSPDFWRAVTRPYASVTFERGIQDARRSA